MQPEDESENRAGGERADGTGDEILFEQPQSRDDGKRRLFALLVASSSRQNSDCFDDVLLPKNLQRL